MAQLAWMNEFKSYFDFRGLRNTFRGGGLEEAVLYRWWGFTLSLDLPRMLLSSSISDNGIGTGPEQNITHRCVWMRAGGDLSRHLGKPHPDTSDTFRPGAWRNFPEVPNIKGALSWGLWTEFGLELFFWGGLGFFGVCIFSTSYRLNLPHHL